MASIFRKGLFDGHVAIVTGGGSGIGLATTRSLGELGAKVAICGRNQEKLAKAEAELRQSNIAVVTGVCDIREPASIDAFVTLVAYRPIAHFTRRLDVPELRLADWVGRDAPAER